MTDRTLTVLLDDDPSGVAVLTLTGELDQHTAPDLTKAVRDAPFTKDRPTVIDLTGLTFCDSTGITVLVMAYQRAEKQDSGLVVAGLDSNLMSVFHIVGLDQILTFAPTLAEAIALLRPAIEP
ncbi:STAS domain-containing protein [Catenulispora sp. NF23]|uniref:Anti-sigma factor antagonist n=1 Tax=Catenulispora pinistramenti TaxID=2705254 RepID=A0ABS5KNI7_9ACTN|nr:STAS domain-containing protein [Catenulispora pinistramenti]MBS2532648.1 STAS domain-containing protein [Catenulispora pinistramenti]MBS2547595.1 STAS domain-containing protein [Catenulispora pinistramenti]